MRRKIRVAKVREIEGHGKAHSHWMLEMIALVRFMSEDQRRQQTSTAMEDFRERRIAAVWSQFRSLF